MLNEIVLDSKIENIEVVTEFVKDKIRSYNCSNQIISQICIAIDELFGNIAKYAYKDGMGKIKVVTKIDENPLAIYITFIDNGIPYNPLKYTAESTSLPVAERSIGGLGILLTKTIMDDMFYEYVENENRLTVKKLLISE